MLRTGPDVLREKLGRGSIGVGRVYSVFHALGSGRRSLARLGRLSKVLIGR